MERRTARVVSSARFLSAVPTRPRGEVMEDALIVLEEDGYSVGALMKFCESYKFYGFPIVEPLPTLHSKSR